MINLNKIPMTLLAGAFALGAGVAEAGPWLRTKGDVFLSFAVEIPDESDQDPYITSYGEWGASERLTLGWDAGGDEGDLSKAIAFARFPLMGTEGDWRVAGEMGLGHANDDGVLRPGFSVGRGFSLGERSGWFTVDTLAYMAADGLETDFTTDVTLGLGVSPKTKAIFQLQSGYDKGDLNTLKLAPSLVFEIASGQHLELGALAEIHDGDDTALKLGLWSSF